MTCLAESITAFINSLTEDNEDDDGKWEIWTCSGSGFMETVSFGVEWLSENRFQMTCDDKDDELGEECIITIP